MIGQTVICRFDRAASRTLLSHDCDSVKCDVERTLVPDENCFRKTLEPTLLVGLRLLHLSGNRAESATLINPIGYDR
jgi:hypothetical protein